MDLFKERNSPFTSYLEKCHCPKGHEIITVLPLRPTCVCLSGREEIDRYVAYAQISLCTFGVAVALMSLATTSTMIARSSTAVLLSAMLLYNVLRLSAVGFLAVFSLYNVRHKIHPLSYFMYLIGTWGVNYTLVDVSLEQSLLVWWPRRVRIYHINPMYAAKKTLLIFLVGLCVNSISFLQQLPNKTDCEKDTSYQKSNILWVVWFLDFALPWMMLLTSLCGAYVDRQGCLVSRVSRDQANESKQKYSNASVIIGMPAFQHYRDQKCQANDEQKHNSDASVMPGMHAFKDYREQRPFVSSLTLWHLTMNGLSIAVFLHLMLEGETKEILQDHMSATRVLSLLVSEVLILICEVVALLMLFQWQKYRTQVVRMLTVNPSQNTSFGLNTHTVPRTNSIVSAYSQK